MKQGKKYWLVLDISNGGYANKGYFNNKWVNAIATGGSVYSEGEAGKGFAKGVNSDEFCNENCSYDGNYSSGSSDWWFKIGRE